MTTTAVLKRYRRQLLIILLTFSGVMACVLMALWPYLVAWYQRLTTQYETLCDCSRLAILPDQSWQLFGLIASVGLFLVLVVRAGSKTVLTYYRTQRYEETLRILIIRTTRVKGVAIYRVQHEQPLAVCLGYLRPRIYISTALEQLLSPTEFWTVIKHELHHAHQYDPLQRLLIGGLAALMPWPKTILNDYQALQEVVADEAAADDRQLRQALVKTLGITSERTALSAVWFTATNARMSRLLGYRPVKPKLWPVVALVLGIMLTTTLLYHSFVSQVQAAEFGQCLAEKPMCELLMSYVAP